MTNSQPHIENHQSDQSKVGGSFVRSVKDHLCCSLVVNVRLMWMAVLCLGFVDLRAQQTYTVSLDNYSIEGDYQGFFVEKVFDNRKDQSHVGLVQYGLNNAKIFAVLDIPLEESLEAVFSRSITSAEGDIPVVIKVNTFYITEYMRAGRSYTRSEVALDFYRQNEEGNWYKIHTSFGQDECKTSSLKNGKGSSLIIASEQAVLDFAYADWQHETGEERDYASYLKRLENMPIYASSRYEDGVFPSFSDFKKKHTHCGESIQGTYQTECIESQSNR